MQDKKPNFHRAAYAVRLTLLALFAAAFVAGARADKAGDVKRAQLAKVKRIVIVPPFFGTDTLEKAEGKSPESLAAEDKSKGGAKSAGNTERVTYVGYLKKLQERAQTWLPERVAARTPYQIISNDELNKTLKEMKKTTAQLFAENGRLHGSKYAQPDPAAVKDLALRLEADAVVMGTLDEPRRNNGGYSFDPLCGMSYTAPDVRSRAGFWVMGADGTEILHNYVDVIHPATKIGSREFLLADWEESQDLVIEDFMDEWTRYTPYPSGPRRQSETAKN